MLFEYKVIDGERGKQSGEIEAVSKDVAISALQKRGLVVVSVSPVVQGGFLGRYLPFLERIKTKELVLVSRQVATLFGAHISASQAFSLLSENTDNLSLRRALKTITEDIKGGNTLANAMAKFPKVFSNFFVAMVRAGEESGNLISSFNFLAEYMERQHEIQAKTKNALVYPAFVMIVFIIVMILMLTNVIPQMSQILLESGQEIPIYTKIVIGVSDILVNYGILIFIFVVAAIILAWYQANTAAGRVRIDRLKLSLPYFGDLYKKIYLSRIADNINTMIAAGIPIVRTLEITSEVVDNAVYKEIVSDSIEAVRAGSSLAETFENSPEVPSIFAQMIRVGEETGSVARVLSTLSEFYSKEVKNSVDTIVSLIEPVMIIGLALCVGILLASVLVPIYNIAGSI